MRSELAPHGDLGLTAVSSELSRLPGGFWFDGNRLEFGYCGIEPTNRLHVVGLGNLAGGDILGRFLSIGDSNRT